MVFLQNNFRCPPMLGARSFRSNLKELKHHQMQNGSLEYGGGDDVGLIQSTQAPEPDPRFDHSFDRHHSKTWFQKVSPRPQIYRPWDRSQKAWTACPRAGDP